MTAVATRRRAGLQVAMALYGDLTYDSRVIREAGSLASAGHAITIACLAASPATVERLGPKVQVLIRRPSGDAVMPGDPSPFLGGSSSRVRRTVDRVRWLWSYRASVARWGRDVVGVVGPVDVWHAHDLTGLEAIVPHVARDTRIVYDSHELFTESSSAAHMPRLARWLLRVREARLVARCEAVITVNPGLAAVLDRLYHPIRIEVVRNCPPRWQPPASRTNLIRETLGLPADTPVVLFHGALVPDRGIHILVSALAAQGLEGVHLVLLGYGQLRTVPESHAHDPKIGHRLHLLPAVPPEDLPGWVASADVGAVLIEPADQSLVLSTPNKLFESIAVGTPVLASDLPEIRRVVLDDPDGPLGVLCDPSSEEAVAGALRRMLTPPRLELHDMSARCLRAADQRLNWSIEAARLLALYDDLGGQPHRVAREAP